MPLSLPRALVEYVLLGPEDDRRQLQDSPLLGDVWIAFAAEPAATQDLLITPFKDEPASKLALVLARMVNEFGKERKALESPRIAHLQGVVAAHLTFDALITLVLPMTSWWVEKGMDEKLGQLASTRALSKRIAHVIHGAGDHKRSSDYAALRQDPLDAYVALIGLIGWAATPKPRLDPTKKKPAQFVGELDVRALAQHARRLFAGIVGWRKRFAKLEGLGRMRELVYLVSLNRRVLPALQRSVSAVKADAARTLFEVKCNEIGWAVLDSGIDATHPAFGGRVAGCYDFTRIREITSLDVALDDKKRKQLAKELAKRHDKLAKEVEHDLQLLADDSVRGRSIDWNVAEHYVNVPDRERMDVASGHGTHVAGIIGSQGDPTNAVPKGLCPDIQLYDFRVLGRSLDDSEFAIIAALQFIRHLNERNGWMMIHGANLSLSIPHDVRNYACGRTPVCNECERLVGSGVVVVAAAGNRGYQSFQTADGQYESYAAFSVTDPGNADGVITVGSTHRSSPHTYGVSFFSSRGPTGDGRIKPDLVAPGEKIVSLLPGAASGPMDGTSMAAPHVCGAAAMLMARYSELIGQPQRIKQILCDSATDLGRERSFQGHGMLDVLRAFQSV